MKIYISIFFFLLAGLIVSQVIPTDTNKSKFPRINSIECINVGIAMPYGSFKESKLGNKSADFILPGVKIDFGYNMQLYRHLGIKTMIIYQNNPMNETAYEADLIKQNPKNSYSKIAIGNRNNLSAFIGVFGNFNLSKKIHFQPRFCFGFNLGNSPQIKITTSDSLMNVSEITQKRAVAAAFAFLVGADLKVDLAKKLQFLCGFEAFGSSLRFSKIRVENSFKNSVYEFTSEQEITTFGLKVGIVKIIN